MGWVLVGFAAFGPAPGAGLSAIRDWAEHDPGLTETGWAFRAAGMTPQEADPALGPHDLGEVLLLAALRSAPICATL